MYKKSIKLLCLLIALMLTMSLAACGSKSSNEDSQKPAGESKEGSKVETSKEGSAEEPAEKNVTLRIYSYYSDDAKIAFDQTVEYMKKIMPNVTIELEQRVDADETKLKTFAAVGNMPDIFESWGSVIRTFQKSGDIAMLDDALGEYSFLDRVVDSVKPTLYDEDGHCYAVNATPPTNALIYYNSKVFEENGVKVPENYDEFLTAVKKFSAKGIIPLALFAQEKWPGVQLYDLLVTRFEPKGYKGIEKGETDITDPAYKKAAKRLAELVDAGLISKSAFSTNASQAFELFKTGRAAMIVNGSWYLSECATYGDHIGYLDNPLADPADVKATMGNRSGGNSIGMWSVAAKSKHLNIAIEACMNWAIENARARIVKLGYPNTLTEEVKPEKPRAAIQEKYSESLSKVVTTTCFPWMLENNEFKTALEESVENLIAGGYTADEFIDYMKTITDEHVK